MRWPTSTGGCSAAATARLDPHHDIPLMVDLYKSGLLMLDELVSLTRPLDRVRRGRRRDARRPRGAWRPHLRLESRPCQRCPRRERGREGRHPRRGDGLAPVPADPDHQQAPAADLRPPDDRLVDRGRGVKPASTRSCSSPAGTHAGEFLRLLGNGHEYGINQLSYAYQEKAGGIAEALGLAEHFADGDPVLVMLADNIVERSIQPMVDAFRADPSGARILLSKVDEPEHLRHLGVPGLRRGRPGGAHRGEARAPGSARTA